MRKIYSIILTAVLLCCGTSVWGAVTVLSEGFEGDLSNWTKQSCHSKSVVGTEAKHDGYYGFLFYYNTNPPQYLISKALAIPSSATEVNVSLYYKAYSSYGTEKFQVGYSTTDNDVANFTWDTEVSTNSTSWAKYTNSSAFPKETKYIAIKYNANDQYRLYIDDIEITCNVSGPALSVFDGETAISSGHNYNFGLATSGTTKTFTLSNPGTEATPVAVAHTGSFGAELSAASIPAGGEVTLTVTMPATTGEDVITISSTAEGIDDFVINVSGTVRDASKMWCNFSEGLPEGWTNSSYTISTTGGGEGTSGGGYAGNTNYTDYRLSTPKVTFAENEKLFLLVAGSSSYSTGTVQIQYSANGTNWTTAKTVSSIASGSWTSVEVTEIPVGTYYIGFYGKYYYLTDIYGGTPVAMPKNVAAAGVTDTEATISWEAAGSETAWQVSYSTTSGDPGNGTIVDANSTSKALTGLNPSTLYYVSVRIGNSGEWSNEISFRTACGAIASLPWSENFESQTADAAPVCWNLINAQSASIGTYPYVAVSARTDYYIGTKALFFRTNSSKVSYAIFPEFSIALSGAQITFSHKEESAIGTLVLGYLTDVEDATTFKKIYTCTSSSSWKTENAILLKNVPADARLAFQHTVMSSYYDAAVDNITIEDAPACAVPTDLAASEVTSNSAKIAWTSEAAAWKLQISTDGENWNDVAGEITNPYTLNGLNDNTKYYVRVCANCGEDGDSEWTAAINFTTECAVKSLPFETEGFESGLPACWSAASQWSYYNYNPFAMRYTSSSNGDLVLPQIVLDDAAQLTFKHQSNYVSCSVILNDGKEHNLGDFAKTGENYKTETVDLSNYIGKTVTIAIRGNYVSGSRYLYIDDVAINYLPVAVPTNLVATPANASAVVTWERAEADAKDSLRYRVNGSEDEWTKVANIEGKTYTIESLINGTTYEVQVKTVASANRQSDWTASAVVTPVSCASVETVTFGAKTYNSVVVNWTATAAATWNLRYKAEGDENWTSVEETISEQTYTLTGLTTNTAYTIAVKPSCNDADEAWVAAAETYTPIYTAPTNVVVTNITDAAAAASWATVADATGYEYIVVEKDAPENWESARAVNEATVELKNLQGLTDYDFYVRATYPASGASDATKATFATIGYAPKNLTLSAVTATTATLTWEYEGAATAYEYAVGDDPDALEWNGVAEKTKILEGLTANTSYTFYVRSKYSDEVKSDSIHLTFRTDCNAIAKLPWFEGFEDMAVGNYKSAAPACWAQLHVNDGLPYAYVNNTSTYVKTGSKSMYVVSSSLTDGYLILPAFEAALNGLQISFSHKEESATKSAVLTLGYITDIANAETFVAIQEFGRATSWQEEKEISLASIPNEVAATARLAFKLGKATDQWYSGIDDITIEEIPDCQKPVLGETTILPDGASFTWTAGGDETKFQYAVDTTETLVWTATETTEATVHGLVPGKDYKFYVRAFCDPDVSDSVWTVFAPVCNAPTEAALTAATTTTASFSWTAAANISSYQYVVMAKGVAADWSKAKTTTNTTAEWTELTASTAYDFYVRSYFNETVQSAAASLSFRTECAAVAALPWSENFEGHPLNAAPACWEVVDPNNTNIYVSTGSTWFDLGTTGLFFEGANANYGYILLPEFEVALNTLQISFSHSEEHSSNSGKIELGYYKDDEFTSLKAYDQSQKAWKAEGPFALTDVPAGARLAFGYKTNNNTYAAAIDNITIEEIPACAVPTDLAASEVTAATATLSWTSEAANFTVQYTTDKKNWGDEHAVAAKTLALEDLTEQTTYYARVKAICGEASESEYCEEISFTTPCAVKSMPYAESFEDGVPACWATTGTWSTNSEYAHSGNALRADVKNKVATLTMPAIAISEADAELVFYVRNVYGGSSYVSGEVIITPTEGEAKHIGIINSNDINNKQKVDLSEFNGKDVVISFSISSVSSTAYVSIDDVMVAKKQCAAPTDLTVQAGNGKADVAWTKGEDETAWQLQYKATAAEDWIQVNDITSEAYSITGLVNGTEYEVQVRAYCDENHQSEWTESATFTPSVPSGFDNTNAEGKKTVKFIENDQIVIIRDGVKYNAQGQKLQ